MKVGEIGAERYEQNISFISNSESRKDKYMTYDYNYKRKTRV